MKRYISGLFLGIGALVAASCGGESGGNEERLGTHDDLLTKCQEPTPGDSNFCDNPACPCTLGEGDCDSSTQCTSGLTCTGKGLQFGYAVNLNVCAPPHCTNKKLDGDETQTDCGGSCGTVCPPPQCGTLPTNGTAGHCTVDCKCAPLEGGCTASNQCQTGYQCTLGHGSQFGFNPTIGVCTATTCTNGVQDGNETGLNCGGFCTPCAGAHIKSKSFGGTAADRVMDFTYDAAGNLIIVGRFGTTINFGPTPASALTTAGGSDVFVAKFDAAGTYMWSRRFGGAHNDGDGAVTVAVDTGSGIYVGGNVYAGADFGSGPITTPDGASNAFLVKLVGTSGATSWSKTFGGTRADRITGIALGPTNAVFVVGSYSDSINLGGATFTAASAGLTNQFDMFVAKLSNASGGHSWSRSFGGVGDDQAVDVTVDSANNPFLVGNFAGTVNFGTGALVASGGVDGVAVKMSSANGAATWVRAIGGTSNNDGVASIAIGSNQHPAVAGYFVGTANLGLGNVTAAATDMFVISLDNAAGTSRWVATGGSAGTDRGLAIAVEKATNNVVVTGSLGGSGTFGSLPAVAASPGGGVDFFITHYSATGTPIWAKAFGSTSSEDTAGASIFDGVVGIGGRFQLAQSFGGATLANAGNFDGFLARYKL